MSPWFEKKKKNRSKSTLHIIIYLSINFQPMHLHVLLFDTTQSVSCRRDLRALPLSLMFLDTDNSMCRLSQLSSAHSTLQATVTSKWWLNQGTAQNCSMPASFWFATVNSLWQCLIVEHDAVRGALLWWKTQPRVAVAVPKPHLSLHCILKLLVWRMERFHAARLQRWREGWAISISLPVALVASEGRVARLTSRVPSVFHLRTHDKPDTISPTHG